MFEERRKILIYERIKKICTEKGLSIRKLEEQAGLGNGVISGWKESSPRVDSLQSAANVLGVPIEYLIKGEETAEPQEEVS